MRVFLCFAFAMLSFMSFAQISSGPMLGYTEMREVLVWIQSDESQNISISYSPLSETNWVNTAIHSTKPEEAFTTKFVLSNLSPGTDY
ncbi:MAG: hypothetical protein ACPGWM_10795, partial [Flavobacteriales bacterium]